MSETKKSLKTPLAHMEFDDQQILHFALNGKEVTDDSIEKNYLMVKEFLSGKKVCFYVDNTESQPYDKKYRLAFEQQLEEFCEAVAVTSGSVIGTAVANIFIAMTKTKVPIRVFNKKESALNWLDNHNTAKIR
ncbi:MAG: hypothetical protein ACI9XP_001466 [Lentimonas sp.]|jgi:hypothetical protein